MNAKNLAAAALVVGAGLLGGCGSSNSPIVGDQQNLAKATTMRSLYTKANGDYSALNATDKATFDKLVGGSGAAEKAWQSLAPERASRYVGGSSDPRAGR